jgi:hypothetical protein
MQLEIRWHETERMDRDLSYWRQIAPFELSEADERSLTQTEEDYVPQAWEELKAAVGELPPSLSGLNQCAQ